MLDLRGHTLDGGGGGTAISLDEDSSPTLRNGTVSGWANGIDGGSNPTDHTLQDEASLFTVSGVTFTGNDRAINRSYAGTWDFGWRTDFAVTGSTFTANDRAIGGVVGGSTTINSSTFTGNGTALYIDTGGVLVTDSRFVDNNRTLFCLEAGCSLTDSTVSGCGGDADVALDVVNATLTLTDSSVSGAGTGVDVEYAQARVTRSVFSRNTTGMLVSNSDMTLSSSDFTRNEYGFRGDGDGPVTLVANRFFRNGDGVLSSTDGIRLRSTTVVSNRRRGIEAPPAVDLGRNVAVGNGEAAVCRRGLPTVLLRRGVPRR